MAGFNERKSFINQILSDLGITIKPVKARYVTSRIEKEEWGRNKYFLFKQENGHTFELVASSIIDLCFDFKKIDVMIVRDYQECLLIANSDMVLYRKGERKVYCHRFDVDETYRIDNLMKDDAFSVTRYSKKPTVKPEKKVEKKDNKANAAPKSAKQ